MTLDISVDQDSGEVVIIYDSSSVLKVVQMGNDASDFKFLNFDKVDDEEIASLIKSFAKSLLLV